MPNINNSNSKMIKTLPMPLLTGKCVAEKRAEIKAYFNNSWSQYQSLFSHINNDEAYYIKAEPLRHPLVFYFGHTATFFINKLLLGKFINKRIDGHLEAICAVGVDEMSWDDLNSENYDWPSIADLRGYRDKVHALIENIIDTMTLELPITSNSLAWVILMGIEHERIHIETSSVIIRMLALEHLTPSQQWPSCPSYGTAPDNSLIAQGAEKVSLAKPDTDQTYGWDNEYGEKIVEVAAFEASEYLVSNQEFLSFVKAGGYQNKNYWNDEGQQWLAYRKPSMPRFWQLENGEYFQRNLFNLIPLPLNWPVEVNYLEAKAFCQWKSEQQQSFIRLPTEAEWRVMRNKIAGDLPDWQIAPGNTNLHHYASSCPVNTFKQGELFDVIGNVWQWNESTIDGFNGFNVHPLYDDFSTPTFDGKHNLIKGGSWISTGNEASKHARYAFRRHFFQHAGFRYIRSKHKKVPVEKVVPFEQAPHIANELALHYGNGFENFPPTMPHAIHLLMTHQQHFKKARALDLGCSVGGASFELAKYFDHIDGIDLTARHIQHALALKAGENVRYALPLAGDLVDYCQVNLSDSYLAERNLTAQANKVDFYQGDALNLKPQFCGYDVIWCGHLLEELNQIDVFLQTINEKLNTGGVLAIATTYQAQNTKQNSLDDENSQVPILGGYKANGENVSSSDALAEQLDKHFEKITTEDFTWLTRKTERRYIFNKSELSLWKKK